MEVVAHRPGVIQTARLQLVVLLPPEIEALMHGDTRRAGELAGVTFPEIWPQNQEAREGLSWHLAHLRADEMHRSWRIRVLAERSTGLVVGSVNLKGPPDPHGDVELGWGVNQDCRRRGYAFEAASAVMAWAQRHAPVRRFSATISDDNVASQQLARKLGMVRTREIRRSLPVWVRVETSA